MNDQLIPFPLKRSRSQMGPWISDALGLSSQDNPSPGAPPAMRAIVNNQPMRADLVNWREASERSEAWSDLVVRSMEQNVFLEPGFALTAAQHFPPARRPSFLMVSDVSRAGHPDRLIGVCALDVADGFRPLTHGWKPKQAALGTPLLDKALGNEAVDVMLAWLTREHPKTVGLLVPAMAGDGPTTALLRARAQALDLEPRYGTQVNF